MTDQRKIARDRRGRSDTRTAHVAGLIMAGVAALTAAAAAEQPARSAASAGTQDESPDRHHIAIKNFMFVPMSLTVKAGATVSWDNEDQEPHTVVSDTGLFRSGAIDTRESFSFRFKEPGTYHFTCSIHPRMVGTIVVE